MKVYRGRVKCRMLIREGKTRFSVVDSSLQDTVTINIIRGDFARKRSGFWRLTERFNLARLSF